MPQHYSQTTDRQTLQALDSVMQQRFERQEWFETQAGSSEEYRLDIPVKCEEKLLTSVELGHMNYIGAPSPECLEALNLSVAASPECIEAINLSVATSPCYNPVDESPNPRDSLKALNDVGASTVFWDHVALDVGNPTDCFTAENLPEPVTSHPSDGLNLEFPHDIDSTSALGDGYILDIGGHVNVSVTDALNASIYFGLHRDAPETAPQKTMAESEAPLKPLSMPAAALDLSHPGSGSFAHAKETYSCSECGKVFRSKGGLRRHDGAHVLGGVGALICDHCGKAFRTSWLLRRHVLAHVSGHVCEICGKRCVDGHKLRRHIATHSLGTFSCTVCRKNFSRSDGLKRHMDIKHLKTKEFKCRLCRSAFSVKCNLDGHVTSVHGGESVQCDVCGKRCKNKLTFRAHVRTHGAPVRACTLCRRSFHRLPHYRRHMRNQHGIDAHSL